MPEIKPSTFYLVQTPKDPSLDGEVVKIVDCGPGEEKALVEQKNGSRKFVSRTQLETIAWSHQPYRDTPPYEEGFIQNTISHCAWCVWKYGKEKQDYRTSYLCSHPMLTNGLVHVRSTEVKANARCPLYRPTLWTRFLRMLGFRVIQKC